MTEYQIIRSIYQTFIFFFRLLQQATFGFGQRRSIEPGRIPHCNAFSGSYKAWIRIASCPTYNNARTGARYNICFCLLVEWLRQKSLA